MFPNNKIPKSGSSKNFQNANIAFEMVAIIAFGAFVGNRLDAHFGTQKPYYTMAFCLMAIGGAMFRIIKQA